MSLLVMCPLALELDYLILRFKEKSVRIVIEQVGSLKVLAAPELNLKFSLAGHGKAQFGIQTQYLLSHFNSITGVFCVGCAGALDKQINIGDVVVAQKTLEHDFKLRFYKKPPPEFEGDSKWLQKSSLIKVENFKIHFGIIASGDEDIIDEKRAEEIRLETGAIAVAWEGAGGARASKFNSVPFIEIRGITDQADINASIDFKIKLKLAMSNSADFILKLLQ